MGMRDVFVYEKNIILRWRSVDYDCMIVKLVVGENMTDSKYTRIHVHVCHVPYAKKEGRAQLPVEPGALEFAWLREFGEQSS